jgi:hypothetical protein
MLLINMPRGDSDSASLKQIYGIVLFKVLLHKCSPYFKEETLDTYENNHNCKET